MVLRRRQPGLERTGSSGRRYIFSEDRKGAHPEEHLKGFRGLFQIDGYAGFDRLVADPAGDAPHSLCWSHARRKFFDISRRLEGAAGRRGPAPDRGPLRDRNRSSWPAGGGTSPRAPATKPAPGRGDARLDDRDSSTASPADPPRPGVPLRAEPLGGIDAVPGRWPPGTRYQHCRTRHPAGHAVSKERLVRGARTAAGGTGRSS